jgi:uncharacterized membrane protein (DUF4010 family)
METATQILFQQLGIALLLGALLGLQRQRSGSAIAGLRTFPLISMLGVLTASVDQSQGANGWIIAAGFLGVVAVVVVTNSLHVRSEHADFGTTTEAAVLLIYILGAYLVKGDLTVAVAIGVIAAVLLQFKPELHGIASRLGDQDLRAIMTFALISGVVLPVLPDETFELVPPFDVLNPFEIWLMVVLMVGISLGGYLVYKFFGRNAGILLGGFLGGAISSTATTISYARRTKHSPTSGQMAALVIAIASSVVFVRVLLEIAVVAPGYLKQLAPPVLIMMGAGVISAFAMWVGTRHGSEEMPQQKNPTELKSALVFAALYAGVLMALSAAKAFFGGKGLFAIAILSGLTDMDAITLSTARMVQKADESGGLDPTNGWRLIVVAAMSNLVFKWGIAAAAGSRSLRWQSAFLLAIPFLVGGLLLWLWPF